MSKQWNLNCPFEYRSGNSNTACSKVQIRLSRYISVEYEVPAYEVITPIAEVATPINEDLPLVPTADHDAPVMLCQCKAENLSSLSPTSGCGNSNCLLKIASRPLLTLIDETGGREPSPPVNVKDLVGAFEDIGCTQKTRPLTIHVDSFTSDPFANPQCLTPNITTHQLTRTQSLQGFKTEQKAPKPKHKFDIKNLTPSAQKLLPYWKIKRSFSGMPLASKDVSWQLPLICSIFSLEVLFHFDAVGLLLAG